MVAQEYHLSLNDLVPHKGLGKLKQTPEKLVNKSEEWYGHLNLGVLVKVKKFLIVKQYSKHTPVVKQYSNTLHWPTKTYTTSLCSKFCRKYATGQQTFRAVLVTANLPTLGTKYYPLLIKIYIYSNIDNTGYEMQSRIYNSYVWFQCF